MNDDPWKGRPEVTGPESTGPENGGNRRDLDKPVELWTRDPHDPHLWHGPHGVIVNDAALAEREAYFHIIRRSGQFRLPEYARRII